MKKGIFLAQAIYLQVRFRPILKIGLKDVQSFVGAMEEFPPYIIGVFISTSGFTEEAKEFTGGIGKKIFLLYIKPPKSKKSHH